MSRENRGTERGVGAKRRAAKASEEKKRMGGPPRKQCEMSVLRIWWRGRARLPLPRARGSSC